MTNVNSFPNLFPSTTLPPPRSKVREGTREQTLAIFLLHIQSTLCVEIATYRIPPFRIGWSWGGQSHLAFAFSSSFLLSRGPVSEAVFWLQDFIYFTVLTRLPTDQVLTLATGITWKAVFSFFS